MAKLTKANLAAFLAAAEKQSTTFDSGNPEKVAAALGIPYADLNTYGVEGELEFIEGKEWEGKTFPARAVLRNVGKFAIPILHGKGGWDAKKTKVEELEGTIKGTLRLLQFVPKTGDTTPTDYLRVILE